LPFDRVAVVAQCRFALFASVWLGHRRVCELPSAQASESTKVAARVSAAEPAAMHQGQTVGSESDSV